jgi:hypothetical protein
MKQTKCYCGHTTYCDCGPEEPKQETLEEAAVINYKKLYEGEPLTQDVPIDAFKKGTKWQQEQILDFLYSEITERRNYSASKMCEVVIEFIEQFKNK